MKSLISNQVIIPALLASALWLTWSCSPETKENADTQKEKAVAVELQSVASEEWVDSEHFAATVEAKTTNKISSTMGGRILRLRADVGQRVAKNQVLAEMDNAQLEQARLQLEEQKLLFARMDALYKSGGIAQADWEKSRRALDVAQTQYRSIAENTRLVSPIHGVVTARNYDPGDVSSPSLPIFVVEQIDAVRLKINLPEKYYPRVTLGKQVGVTTETLPNERFVGRVALIYPSIDPQTHTFTIEIEVSNPKQLLRSGMYASVEMDFGSRQALVVWDRSVLKQIGSGEKYVYVVEKNRAVRRNVEVGSVAPGKAEILSGLQVGEKVVREGASTIKDGSLVKVISPKK